MNDEKKYGCGFELTIDIIGGKWKGLILWHLNEQGILRNNQLLRFIPSITQKMLTQQLREMEENSLVSRKIYEQIPPKVEYTLTNHGKKLHAILKDMRQWGIEYATEYHIPIE
ncbi:winged helix-turn-helix transcriptional regulator [Aliarcobacter butzleri]|uniref:Helix-turn-helix domain-containing protein n=1 Tax=Aliarcobacter butzleri TaxID=28197 RepID=A0AAW7Q1K2_9BACT|nr:helix-turn-helix domain-containing protein [Aliarcobacter butzleri]MCG3714220.1 helix-turn-helix transcriptional regulator [Aliarcobacter butzleri]MCT7586259.1 helix-turn-helix transcriptional regulator [Aliarcobacter butzleri]MDN5107965.1 helix-turn-helix domain-containing protein [Aliarcobacter butzleri]MDN5111109.1 helix-turn-helix domain-containing protein [Aliarcobacter butzleri]MDN5113064.1 helix-turn-helix domain-containing protein [Aliarcobacter butzleri]